MLLVFLVGVAMVVAGGVGLAMFIDPEAFVEWSRVRCGDSGECGATEVRILGALLAFVVGPLGIGLALSLAPWRR